MWSKNPVAAIDIGSSKICCAVGRFDPTLNGVRILGVGQHASRGIKNGMIVDMDEVEQCVLQAVHGAEQVFGENIQECVVNISGADLLSEHVEVSVSIAGHEVDDSDLYHILDQGMLQLQNNAFDILHSIPLSYKIDGNAGIQDPRGMYGERLSGKLHVITSSQGPVKNIATCLKRCHLEVPSVKNTAFMSGLAVLVEDEMNLGTTVIDIGGGLTHMAIFFEGKCVHTDSLPLGGRHITRDIARVLSTPLVHAERVKNLYGGVVASKQDAHEEVTIPQVGEDATTRAMQIRRSDLIEIMQARVEEILQLVLERLQSSGMSSLATRRFVLTGGSSQIPGIRDLASRIFGKQVRLGKPLKIHGVSDMVGGPAFSTCAGLIVSALRDDSATHPQKNGLFTRIGTWIKENF